MKRPLTAIEIDEILKDLGKDLSFLSEPIRQNVLEFHKRQLRLQLEKIYLHPELIPKMKRIIHMQFYESLISPGENVGVICAQSIGEKQTQSTLNSFHAAGIAIQMVLTGVPRFMEILNATKDPKISTSRIRLCDETHESARDVREYIGSTLVHISFRDIIVSYSTFHFHRPDEIWYYPFSLMYGNEFREYEHGFSIQINKKILYQYRLSMYQIREKIQSMFEDIHVVISPLHIGQIDIFVDISDIESPPDHTFLDENNYIDVYLHDVVMEKLKDITLCGMSGIRGLHIQKDHEKRWYVETVGNNFLEILGSPKFDPSSAISNNMWDIYSCLGIEAARQYLFEELWNLVTSDGSFINPCHVSLLVDIMTHHGNIVSISRYGVKKEQIGVLGRASFEESTDHFLNAAFFSEKEMIRGVSASIICGKRSRMGTGICELTMDTKQIDQRSDHLDKTIGSHTI
jgi:DNA-directed RNA polymerase beta' subunit